MIFNKNNLNPKDNKTGDCVVRAIMKGTKQTWTKVYQDLCKIGLELVAMPNSPEVYQKYLKDIGWTKQRMPKIIVPTINGYGEKGTTYKRLTVEEFADENPKGTFIISVANHLTVIVDGTLIDTWNCSYKSMGNYWTN